MKNYNSNQLKIGAILTYLSMGLGFLISLIYTPYMLKFLGQSEYGLYNMSSSVISYLGVLNFGFGSAYINFYTRYKIKNDNDSISKLNGLFIIIFLIIGLVAFTTGITLSRFTDIIFGSKLSIDELDIAKTLMIILTINLAFSFPSIVFVSYIRANEHFIFYRFIDLLKTIFSPFVILPVLLLGYGSIGMAIVITLINIFIEIVYIIFSFKKLKISFKFKLLDKRLIREITIFSSFIFISLVIDQINWNVDKYLIGLFHGTIPVAVYSLASIFNTQYLSISTAISTVFVPRVYNIIHSIQPINLLSQLFVKIGRIQFILLSFLLSGFIFFGKAFIFFWAGNEYIDSYYIVIILLSSVTIPIIQNIGLEIQRAMNLHKFRSIVYLIIALINICISIPLVITYKGIGAAIGTAFALLIGNGIIMNIYYYKKIGLDIPLFWLSIVKIFPAFLFPSIFGYFYTKYTSFYQPIYLILGVLLYSIVFIISMWFVGMNTYEKNLIKAPFNKLFLKMGGKNR